MIEPITIQAQEVRSCFKDMLENVRFGRKSYLITKQKKPAGILLGFNEYEDMLDMIDTMAEQLDPEFQTNLIEGKKEIEEGKGISETELDRVFRRQINYGK